jgi:hypothetical protein
MTAIETGVCPDCSGSLDIPGEKWCQQCILEANIMAAAPDDQPAAITALAEHVRAEERERIIQLAGQEAAEDPVWAPALTWFAGRLRHDREQPLSDTPSSIDGILEQLVSDAYNGGAADERERIIALAIELHASVPADHPEGARASFADYLRVTEGTTP